MRYTDGQRERTRDRILDVAGRLFREQGVASSGMAGLMAAAGLTNGAFYAHFPSKEALVQEVLAHRRQGRFTEALREGEPPERWIRLYLNPDHRDRPGEGCMMAPLAAEIGRHPPDTRERFCAALGRTIELIAAHVPGASEADRLVRAHAVFGLMMGTLQLARATGTGSASDAILGGGVRAALALCLPPGG
ncbi:TetR/AcrR family transcriptional regulator [Rhizosaccharibacter radicis]|uniref:TetR/AcrR family transcriptional regulator n=1 Tax=Rhizosaccharibacter radicis TaxID=2782605 RepID=A0ABT1VV74_9PROT|nr:TetR/AcrR family transcriptional regulator [Acetobacteraceae bacterium KSS12]